MRASELLSVAAVLKTSTGQLREPLPSGRLVAPWGLRGSVPKHCLSSFFLCPSFSRQTLFSIFPYKTVASLTRPTNHHSLLYPPLFCIFTHRPSSPRRLSYRRHGAHRITQGRNLIYKRNHLSSYVN